MLNLFACLSRLIMIVTYGIMFVCDLIIPMRVTEEEEHIGLDITMHNESVTENTMKVLYVLNGIPLPALPSLLSFPCCYHINLCFILLHLYLPCRIIPSFWIRGE